MKKQLFDTWPRSFGTFLQLSVLNMNENGAI